MFQQMIGIMAEIIRKKKRSHILQSNSISLALDDKGPYRVLRYRTCSKQWTENGGAKPTHEGILAVLKHGGCGSSMTCADLDEDYSLRIADSVQTAVKRLATPLGEEVDDRVVQHFLENVRVYASDGGKPVRKAGQLLRQRMPSLRIFIRDRAHAIRRASLPITFEENFEAFWHHVWDKRHAVIPDIQNSDEFKLRLLLIQKSMLEEEGVVGSQALTRALRTLSFAKQRFDSYASPQAKYVALLLPIAVLLASLAADARKDPTVRARSLKALEMMTPEHIVTAGLSADFSAELLRFVRLHDVRNLAGS